jgi:hypothetical protein
MKTLTAIDATSAMTPNVMLAARCDVLGKVTRSSRNNQAVIRGNTLATRFGRTGVQRQERAHRRRHERSLIFWEFVSL